MDIYIALHDYPDGHKSGVIGGFSDEEKARTACQEHENGVNPLTWKDTSAEAPDGCSYDIVLVTLDVAT
jgi:hypothetical protein